MYDDIDMIKLIAVDMDGTFLNDKKEMSPEFPEVFKRLKKKGITFCAASGRQLASLKKEFEPYIDEMEFVAENGTVVEYRGKIISKEVLSKDITQQIMDRVKKLNGKKVVYCTPEYSYIDDMSDEQSKKNALLYLPKHKVVDSFDEIDELPVKISIYSKDGYDEDFREMIEIFGDVASVCTSGFEWLDIVPKNSNKGNGLKKLQEKLGITNRETMVFGDQMNDFQMMSNAYYSYAMDNAVDEIKQVSRFTAPSNNEFGVIKVIKDYLDMK